MPRPKLRWRFNDKPAPLLSAAHASRLAKSSPEPLPSPENREFINAKQAAEWLGIPLRSLNLYVQRGILPSYKLGRHRLFRRNELRSAITGSRLATRADILR
ncbi:MAG: helix-turn-helix domain-containing protein [Terrimicrobiaceae bacterium]|nr:helix-turn-helix domain-containing protein [Terrimicrobiaceae bacterium]